jgi:two-component system sensor histidine kinase PilS (NtrC family)
LASLASIGLLAEHVYSVSSVPAYSGTSTQVGILGASLIATAIVTHSLVMRARSSEQLIQQRERDVALLSALNQEIIENMEAGVIVLGRKDQVRHINRAARQLLHLPRDGSISLQRDCSWLQTSLDAWRAVNANQSILRPQTTEIDNLQVNFRQLLNEGQPNTMVFLNDVSSIRESMRQARLASLGHLTASIAHEIRNPLGAISYAAELLDEGERFDEADKRMVDIINQHTRRINHIIEDILNISRGSTTARERIDLGSWLPTFVEEFSQSGLAATESFVIAIETSATQLMFDNGHLNQILTNLCTNACVHGDTDKPITLRVFRDPGDALCIEVADQGPGISDEILEQIFEPFYTTSHQGSGLGLYIVAQLCELNSASVSARVNQHNGTSFVIRSESFAQETGNRFSA